MRKMLLSGILFLFVTNLNAEDGYALWLRYKPVSNSNLLASYRQTITALQVVGHSPTLEMVRKELRNGLNSMLQTTVPVAGPPGLIAATLKEHSSQLGTEGFIIRSTTVNGRKCIVINANTDIGVLYGAFHFLRLIQTEQSIQGLNIVSVPRHQLRMLDHWDNLDRYVERGYAGISIWNWHTLPTYLDVRYTDYARYNAAVGINGAVLNNVNANATVLTTAYLQKVAALAAVFRPYGIKVYLSARFSAPIETGHLRTADPLNDTVKQWWHNKAKEIYTLIPDFGGFLVKANSEGQPGPQNYGRNHADGANMLADAVAPYGGIVMWRAFVYNPQANDRFKQAYEEFTPLDGQFRRNVMVQVKNGPIDFQPREPISPLFHAMPHTPLMMEFQLTQEYLGQGTHLVFLAPFFKEVLKYCTVAGIAAVANTGNERNWTGHPFGQANWYALGRLSWNDSLSSEQIADEWVRQTFSNSPQVVSTVKSMMLPSHEAVVNYMTPLGLHHIMGNGHHYGPAPWDNDLPRADWNPVYYHKADTTGIGFDRTATGSNALAQYRPAMQQHYTRNEQYLLWFHHASWKQRMRSGRNLWEELCYRYNEGVDTVRGMQQKWHTLKQVIDEERYQQVSMLLAIQEKEAVWWRNACLLYFQTFSHLPVPAVYEQPDHTLDYYKQLRFPYAPGN